MDSEKEKRTLDRKLQAFTGYSSRKWWKLLSRKTAVFGQDTDIDPFAETVTEPVALLITTLTSSVENFDSVLVL